jgi:hypothetical protein
MLKVLPASLKLHAKPAQEEPYKIKNKNSQQLKNARNESKDEPCMMHARIILPASHWYRRINYKNVLIDNIG